MRRAVLLAALAAAVMSAQAGNVPEAAAPCPDAAAPKVAFVFEGVAWEPHLAAVRRVTEQLGAAACVRVFDHLSTGVDPDANARFLLGSLGLQRYAAVFLLTPRHAEAMAKVVEQFTGTTYLQLDGKAQGPNLVPYRLKVEEAGQLAGALAAAHSPGGRVGYTVGAGMRADAAWLKGLRSGARRVQREAELAKVDAQEFAASGAGVLAVAGASEKELRALRGKGITLVAWNEAPQGVAGKDILRLWADWTPFYLAAAKCALAGKPLKVGSVDAGVEEGVITGDAKVLASAAWRQAPRHDGPAAGFCP